MMDIKPLVNIGEKVDIKAGICIQTSYGWNMVHLSKGFRPYVVHDIKVTVSLKSGKIEYSYLIGQGSPEDRTWFHGGWVDGRHLELVNEEKSA